MMKQKNTFTTGEFAELCKTTKETLFHYDRENLLKPKYVSNNGYRYYVAEQYFDFDMITMLKETGSTLKEIGAYIQNMDGRHFLSLLEAKRLAIKKERARLAQREIMLLDMAVCTREALDFDYDIFRVQKQEEERLEIVPTTAALVDSASEFATRLAGFSDFYDKQKRVPRYPFGMILSQEGVLQEPYPARYFFSRATRSTPRSRLHVKPEGNYAVLAHKGTEQTHMQTFGALLRQIETARLTVAGNAYIYDMMSYVLQESDGRYAVKYCIAVQES